MNLNEALTVLAKAGDLDPDELISYAIEDTVGGRDTGHWSAMSIFEAEGKILYALIRALRPSMCVEIGTDSGGSATHMLTALQANKKGKLYSIDLRDGCGDKIPEALRSRWIPVVGDALEMPLPNKIDFVFEDGSHHFDFTSKMLLRLKAFEPKVILSHDAVTDRTYQDQRFEVLPAFKAALGVEDYVLVEPSIAGLAYWWNNA